MKLNVTSSIITSPTLENHFLCTHLVVECGDRSMIVNCTSEEWDMKPIDRLDKERCPWYGQWEASFYHAGCDEPVLSIGLGDTELAVPEGAKPQYGIELFGMEALSEDTAITMVVNAVLWRLLQSPNYERTPSVILSDRLGCAAWLMRTGIQHGKKEGDFKISRFFKGIGVERLYNYGAGSGLKVKQTLVTYTHEQNRRETQLFFAGEHVYVTTKEFGEDPERYVNSFKQPRTTPPVVSQLVPPQIHIQLGQIVQFLRQAGYSENVVYQLIDETNELAEKNAAKQPRMGQPMIGGHNQMPMGMPFPHPMAPNVPQFSYHNSHGLNPNERTKQTPPVSADLTRNTYY